MIIDAANTMFNQANTAVLIRLPGSGDTALSPKAAQSAPKAEEEEEKKKTAPSVVKAPEPKVEPKEPDIIEEPEEEDSLNEDTGEQPETKPKENVRLESDQEKMILDLFDGKYIE